MTPFDFLLWGFVDDTAFVSPFRTENMDFKCKFTEVVTLIAGDMLIKVCEEMVYKIYVYLCHVNRVLTLNACKVCKELG
jgi:hypothetical protein